MIRPVALKIRVATGLDIPEMHRVRMSVRENVLRDVRRATPDHYRQMLEEYGRGWVCEVDGRIVGFGVADRAHSNLWALFVEPSYEGRGIGRRLHQMMLDWLFQSGTSSVWLSTEPGTRAESFYKRANWQYVGREPNGESRYAMTSARKSLRSDEGENMSEHSAPIAVVAADVPPRPKRTVYPEPFAARVQGRDKTPLGDLFGLTNYGVNLTRLAPGAVSALRHAHEKQDEFVYILHGEPTLITDEGATRMSPGMCAGFKAGTGNAHHLVNRTASDVIYLEIGDRTPETKATFPDDDIQSVQIDGKWRITHKDGRPY